MKIFLRKLMNFPSRSLEKGFSMAEVMAATAILGIVIVATVSQLKLSSKSALDMAADAEINNITNKVISAIGNHAVCYKNFGTRAQANTYTQLLNTDDTIIAKTGTVPGDPYSEVQLSRIETKSVNANEMTLVLSFEKKKFGLGTFFTSGPKREIPIMTSLVSGNIQYCFANYDLVIKTAIMQACIGDRSYYNETVNPPFGSCEHLANNLTCGANEFLHTVTAADGTLTFTCGPITGVCPIAGQAIVGYNPDGSTRCDYVLPECQAGEVIVKHAGGHICKKIDCTNATGISAFGGFDANGDIICTQIATTSNVCGTNQYATGISGDGKVVTCSTPTFGGGAGQCAVGKFVSGIDGSGNIVCTNFINIPATCQPGEAVQGVGANGDVSCDAISRNLACGPGHTYNDCVVAGGLVRNNGTATSHCMFSGVSCPAGWSNCQNYRAQYQMSCTDTANTFYCEEWQQTRTVLAPAGNNVYSNNPRASVTCKQWNGSPGTGGACVAVDKAPTYTTVNQIGCY